MLSTKTIISLLTFTCLCMLFSSCLTYKVYQFTDDYGIEKIKNIDTITLKNIKKEVKNIKEYGYRHINVLKFYILPDSVCDVFPNDTLLIPFANSLFFSNFPPKENYFLLSIVNYRIIRKSTRKYNYDAPYSIIKRDSVMYFEYPIGYYDRGYKIYYVAEKCLIVFLDINS